MPRKAPVPRPVGWGPEFLLGWLREHPGEPVGKIVAEVASRCGEKGVQPNTIHLEIAGWRKKDRDFALAYRELTGTGKHLLSVPERRSKDRVDPDWRQKWALAFLETKNHRAASAAAGLDPHTTWRKRRPGDAEFDEEFFAVYQGCLEALKDHYEDVLHNALAEAELFGDNKTVINGTLSILERVAKEKWTRAEDRSLTVNATHNVNVTVELSEGAKKAMRQAELLSAKIAGALGPGATAIDVTPRRVEAAVRR